MSGAGKLAPLVVCFAISSVWGVLECRPSQVMPQQSDAPEAAPARLVPKAVIEKEIPPIYPPKAREMRIQGTVVLTVIVSKKGKVKEISVVSGHPLLVPAAIDAVKQSKYKPYRIGRHAVEAEATVVVNFALE